MMLGFARGVGWLGSLGHPRAGALRSTYSSMLNHGCTSDLERLPEDQPREHPHQGVPGHRVERDNLVSSAPWRMPDAHSAETLVPVPQPRGAALRDREGVRV